MKHTPLSWGLIVGCTLLVLTSCGQSSDTPTRSSGDSGKSQQPIVNLEGATESDIANASADEVSDWNCESIDDAAAKEDCYRRQLQTAFNDFRSLSDKKMLAYKCEKLKNETYPYYSKDQACERHKEAHTERQRLADLDEQIQGGDVVLCAREFFTDTDKEHCYLSYVFRRSLADGSRLGTEEARDCDELDRFGAVERCEQVKDNIGAHEQFLSADTDVELFDADTVRSDYEMYGG